MTTQADVERLRRQLRELQRARETGVEPPRLVALASGAGKTTGVVDLIMWAFESEAQDES